MDLRDLYQEVILDHNKNPRHFHAMKDASSQAEGFNPLCGDKLSLFLKIENNKIIEASFVGSGCAISTASASLLTDTLRNRTLEEAHTLFHDFHDWMMEEQWDEKSAAPESLGKLSVMGGVRLYPARVKCATLAWHTLEAALKHAEDPHASTLVTTE